MSPGSKRIQAAYLFAAALFLVPLTAFAHERFIKHALRKPLDNGFFLRDPAWFLHIHPNMLRIAVNVFVVISAVLVLWFARWPLEKLIKEKVRARFGSAVQSALHLVACFFTDRQVKHPVFHAAGEWAVILFLRSPGLVLMYSATNDSLVMPSYPLDPASATFFKFAQAVLAILILTQTLLPLCGAVLFGTWLYLFRWGWMVAVDAMPLLPVAIVYATSPWQSHKLPIWQINEQQMRWVRITLGFGFLVLGWFKIYNHDLVAGVADQFPDVMKDPMVKLMTLGTGTGTGLAREPWIVAFGLAEVMSGFLLMTGVFTRVWGAIMIFLFTKLMLVDFGWEEIPHIYPIGALLAVVLSNKLTSSFTPIERRRERAGRDEQPVVQASVVTGASVLIGFLVVFPILYLLTFLDRSSLQ